MYKETYYTNFSDLKVFKNNEALKMRELVEVGRTIYS